MSLVTFVICRFETIRNNTALKLVGHHSSKQLRFETIRNNTALKQFFKTADAQTCFETIRNNTALKLQTTLGDIEQVLKPFETTQL